MPVTSNPKMRLELMPQPSRGGIKVHIQALEFKLVEKCKDSQNEFVRGAIADLRNVLTELTAFDLYRQPG